MATKFNPNEKNEINGTENADAIVWESAWNKAITVNAMGGNDKINFSSSTYNNKLYGYGGNDTISGGSGNDYIDGGLDNDLIYGTAGNNTLKGQSGDDTIIGGTGSDTIYGGNGNDQLLGGNGNDTIYGGSENDLIKGHDGNDDLVGDDGNDTIEGGNGDDRLWGTSGFNVLKGQDGNDIIYGGTQIDTIYGGTGKDQLLGGSGDDIIYGEADDDIIKGNAGDDIIYGEAGNDSIRGNAGNDTMYGNDGDDNLRGEQGNNYIYGGNGDDFIAGGTGNDYIEGNNGNDYIYGQYGKNSIKGGAGNDHIYGGTDNDILYAGIGDDTVLGGKGDDIIYGEYGFNLLKGGDGNDTIHSGMDEDDIYAEKGDDIIYLNGDGGSLYFYSGDGNDIVKFDKYKEYDFTNSYTLVFKDFPSENLIYEKSKDNLIIRYGENYSDSVIMEDFFYYNPENYISYADNSNFKIKGNKGDSKSIKEISPTIITNPNEGGTEFNDMYTITNSEEVFTIWRGPSWRDGEGGTDTLYFKNTKMEDLEFSICGNNLYIGYNKYDGEVHNWVIMRYMNTPYSYPFIIKSSDGQMKSSDDILITQGFRINGNEIQGSAMTDYINGTDKDDLIYGNDGHDIINGNKGNDTIIGGGGSDTIDGGDGDDIIYGMLNEYSSIHEGSDNILRGGNGNDIIYGTWGDDILNGDNGNDIIYGLGGNDTISGGAGTNYLYSGTSATGKKGNNTYINSSLANNDIIFDSGSMDDYGFIEDYDTLLLTGDNKNSLILYFDLTLNGTNIVANSSRNMYITNTADFGSSSKGVIVRDNFITGRSIEKVTTADGYYLTDTQINNLRQNIANWLYTNGFTSVQEIIDSGNQTNINALIAQFQNANWQHA